MNILEILKWILAIVGIVVVASFVVIALGNLVISIFDNHGKGKEKEETTQQITYEQPKLLENNPEPQATLQKEDIKEVDLELAKQEEKALNFGTLAEEEALFIKEKQRQIEERLSQKANESNKPEEVNLDEIFFEEEQEDEISEEEEDENIEDLINRILQENDVDGDDEEIVEETTTEIDETPVVAEETIAEVEEAPVETLVESEEALRIKQLEEELARQKEEYEGKLKQAQEQKQALEVAQQEAAEEVAEIVAEEEPEAVATVEETTVSQEEVFAQTVIEEVIEQANSEEMEKANQRIAELERMLAQKEEEQKALEEAKRLESEKQTAEKLLLEQQLASAQTELEVKAEQVKQAEEKLSEKVGPTLSLEEYEARLETLKERLRVNEKELKTVKKEYLPLAKIQKSWEKDKIKLRRKEALVAKQKVMLYGVNNYVDIDEEKAKKLSEDLDLLEGLRLSVQHCEEVMKANEDRYPILEKSYNVLFANNENIKADIEECMAKIEELKADQE
ncbi:MAG: hypothetical protein E7378_00285 [Clostridiales bacterium]|nr:hypothetical protein [Clostridiales bacterium]